MVNLSGLQRWKIAMDIPEDPQERKKWLMQVLQDYGREFLIFEPEDQPHVSGPAESDVFHSLQRTISKGIDSHMDKWVMRS
jgi:hypothetical protein